MSLLDFLGAGKSIADAQTAATEIVQQIAPISADIENRFGGIMHGVLDRLNGARLNVVEGGFELVIPPLPKATPVDQ
jgi:hypothetical protein